MISNCDEITTTNSLRGGCIVLTDYDAIVCYSVTDPNGKVLSDQTQLLDKQQWLMILFKNLLSEKPSENIEAPAID